MTSAENSVSEPPNLRIFWGRISPVPPKRLVPSALARVPPLDKNPSHGPGFGLVMKQECEKRTGAKI